MSVIPVIDRPKRSKKPRTPRPRQAPPRAGARHRLLVVEDDPRHQQQLQQDGLELPYEFVFVATREEAQSALVGERFCAVVSDVSIPGAPGGQSSPCEGLDLIGWVRARFSAAELPVIANSSSSLGNELAAEAGADDVSRKQLERRQLAAHLARTCEARHPQRCPNLADPRRSAGGPA